jgi:lycopene cyclase domain-containing protein
MAVMPDRYQYLALMLGCLLITLPLELFIGARVWRQPRRLVLALAPTVAVFVAWDLVAIARGNWGFVGRYVTGWELPGDLPVEELAFFLVIPICGLLTLEAVRTLLGESTRPAAVATGRTDEAAARA